MKKDNAEQFLQRIRNVEFEPSYKLTNADGALLQMMTPLAANRTLKPKKVSAIKDAMKRGEYMPPIIVSFPSLVIVEGHHRYQAAMECLHSELPFTLRVNISNELDESELNAARVLNNTQTKWDMKDVLHSYVVEGNDNYIRLKEIMSYCPMVRDLTIGLLLVSNGRSKPAIVRAFNNGQLTISNEDSKFAYILYNELSQIHEIIQDNIAFSSNHMQAWISIRSMIDSKFFTRLSKSYKMKAKRADYTLPSRVLDWKSWYIELLKI